MKITIEQLQTFISVCHHNSFSAASKELGKHRTSVAQIIAFLEETLGLLLFERANRQLIQTEQAKQLYFYAKQTVEQAKSFEHVARSLTFNELNRITIAYSGLLPKVVLSKLRVQIESYDPQLLVNFERVDTQQVSKMLEQDVVQFAIVDVDEREAIGRFERVFLTHLNFHIMASKHHTLFKIEPKQRFEALRNMRQFIYKEHLDGVNKSKLLYSSNYEVVNDMELMIQLINDGLGWGILPKTVNYLYKDATNVQLVEVSNLKDDFRIPFALWSKFDHRLTYVKELILDSIIETREEIYQLKFE
ncbi:LysR family transcriptional regulator [Vibrio astriarenae]